MPFQPTANSPGQLERLRRVCMVDEGSPQDVMLRRALERDADDALVKFAPMRSMAVVSWPPGGG